MVPEADGGLLGHDGKDGPHLAAPRGVARGNLLVQGEMHRCRRITLKGGVFYWKPGLGFLGEYSRQFDRRDGTKIPVRVKIAEGKIPARI